MGRERACAHVARFVGLDTCGVVEEVLVSTAADFVEPPAVTGLTPGPKKGSVEVQDNAGQRRSTSGSA